MCGILGFVDKRCRLSDREHEQLWRQMVSLVSHRGGEGEGVYRSSQVTLAHTRLRILDLDARSDQPFASAQCGAVLTFNGQIYNHLTLKAELARHFTYATRSDTETLLYAYALWGRGFVKKLRGMYAFAIWDVADRQLTLGVDPLGIKPLYYLDNKDWFAWSSEVKPLLVLPGVRPVLDEAALHEFMCYRSLTGARTMFAGIRRLKPAQILAYDARNGVMQPQTHWTPPPVDLTDGCASSDEVREALRTSVLEHAPADVPVGIQLSGGLDSSLIARLLRDALPRDYELHSFCVSPLESGWSEFGYARRAAKVAGTIHHEILFDDLIFADLLHKATFHLDEPINHPNTVPLMHLAVEARKSVKVLFSGEGADELFCGYKRHVRFLRDRPTPDRLCGSNRVNTIEVADSVLRHRSAHVDTERFALASEVGGASPARQLMLYDLSHHLPAHLLRQDKMGMAANLEIRVPFLDMRLVELALTLPDEHKIVAGAGKLALRRAGNGLIPRAILRRPKRGFGLPVGRWLRNPVGLGGMLKRVLLDEQRRSFLNYAQVRTLYADHQASVRDNSDILWPLLSLEIWCRCFLDGQETWKPSDGKWAPRGRAQPALTSSMV